MLHSQDFGNLVGRWPNHRQNTNTDKKSEIVHADFIQDPRQIELLMGQNLTYPGGPDVCSLCPNPASWLYSVVTHVMGIQSHRLVGTRAIGTQLKVVGESR